MKRRSVLLTLLLAGAFGLCVGPFYWLAMAATQKNSDVFSWPPKLLPGGHLMENLQGLQDSIGLTRVLFNTVLVAGVQTAGAVVVSVLAGYAFAKFEFRGRNLFFVLLLSTLVLPDTVMLIPIFEMMMKLGLIDSYQSVILPGLVTPFGIFLMRQALRSMPDELLDAARVDGAGELRVLWRIVIPVNRPVIAALALFVFLGGWNQFVWPLIALRSPDMYTLPVATATLQGLATTNYAQVLLAAAIAAIPVMALFLVLQRQFISGLLAGATKE
ncbi:carbohydrate ABC transporter permease [Streptomyces sp. NBC_01435]|uniref:carbohydrate ABC transporter permease n=1 Tax=Streptomyces sp. NBC_01435 TaxID=2903865 RepID=UPI002E30023E|nr:carbohydrate ABC transporter permease [Streptomyces sp. NBC_01435]